MHLLIVLLYKREKAAPDLIQRMESIHIELGKPVVLKRTEPAFDFLYEYSYKKSYTKDFFIRIFLKRALEYSILS
jgi:hypothetical protein